MYRVCFLIFLGLLGRGICLGQSYTTPKTAGADAVRAWRDGRAQVEKGEYAVALGYFEEALRKDPKFIDARLDLANMHALLFDHLKAKQFFLEALAQDSIYEPGAYYELAKAEWVMDQYGEAAVHLESYLRSGPKSPKAQNAARQMLIKARFAAQAIQHPVPFHPQSVGDGVNTKAEEYFPCLTADGETMIFTRRDGNDENFYKSELKEGVWQKAEPLVGINTTDNEGAESISPDGTWLVYTACNRTDDGSQGSCDLYWSQERSTGWTKPVPFSATINSVSWDSQPTISADGKTIIFSSRRPGGYGREDLWATRKSGGKWSKPENLGSAVNTGGAEQTPFLHPDGETLYFASDSLPGMGGLDLFCVRKNPDGNWGSPVNLGYPINTKSDEIALFVSLDGKTAYYATNHRPDGTKGSLDIYSFELPEAVRPKPVTYAKVHVQDAITRSNLFAKLEFTDLKTNQVYVTVQTRKDGTALACLPAGRDYGLHVSKDKYFFHSENFNLVESASFKEPFRLDVLLQRIPDSTQMAAGNIPEAGKAVALRNVFFETGQANLLPESTEELDRLADLMTQTAYLKIQINGHTDNVGNKAANQTLSEARAKAVYDYLTGKGIGMERLRYKGFGETRPIEANETAEGRAKNRRTEFEVW
jgi:outer membrane protein OmpA-like peptidoglycan-associated protein